MNETSEFPGSRWWKTDIHVHTPGSGSGYDKQDATEDELLMAAMARELDCMVITDHNNASWVDRIKARNHELQNMATKPDWYREITIFPGVEITVGNSGDRVHLLAVFDVDCDTQKVTSVLGACGIHDYSGNPQDISTKSSFTETVNIIERAGGIPIPAHIDGKNGLAYKKTTLGIELEKSLKSVYAAEFCDINAYEESDPQLIDKINRLAKLGGSDAHTPNEIGKHYSWVKMSIPSLEAIQLALMDHIYCINNGSEDPNHMPDIWINKLEISNMKYCGRTPDEPLIACFNPELNALIGGRGSGKSTMIESIRIALERCQELSGDSPNTKKKLDRFMYDRENVMRSDTSIILELWRYGKQYRISWHYSPLGSFLEERIDNGFWQTVESGNLQDRFPVSIYSQKQIEELASNPKGLLNIIDKSALVNRSEWDADWESTKSRYLQLCEKRRDLIRRISDESNVRTRLSDLDNDLKQYEAKGHGDILKKYQRRTLQKGALPSDEAFNSIFESITELVSTIGLPDFPSHLFDNGDDTVSELKAIFEKASAKLLKAAKDIEITIKGISTTQNEYKQAIASSKWSTSYKESSDAYNALVEEYLSKGSRLDLSIYGEWTQEYHRLQQKLQSIDSIKTELGDVEKQMNECTSQLLELRRKLLVKRQNFINSVIGGNPYVRMEIIPFGDVSTLEENYRDMLNIEGDIYSSSIQGDENRKGILSNLLNWRESATSTEEIAELLNLVKENTLSIVEEKAEHHGLIYVDGRLKSRLKELWDSKPMLFDQLSAWFTDDLLVVKYLKDQSSRDFDNIERGSAGQKAAAILAFLLSYGEEPLIIDQPEDDLDNELIYSLIVNQIHQNKTKRQLVIATHNPNIVVNGIAELITSMRFSNGQVKIDKTGGLAQREIRDSVCAIMEGGRIAFDKRYKRITMGG
jgi:ABC-type lipoprotein export system ATPase subunit